MVQRVLCRWIDNLRNRPTVAALIDRHLTEQYTEAELASHLIADPLVVTGVS